MSSSSSSSSSSSDGFDPVSEVLTFLAKFPPHELLGQEASSSGSSRRRRVRKVVPRAREAAHEQLVKDYFVTDPEMRRNELRQRRFRSESESGENENEEGGSSSHSRMKCRSCKEEYRCDGEEAGTCRKCFEKAGETEDELKSKVNFLRLLPIITLTGIPKAFSEVVLVASDEDSSPPIPANWAVLISRSPVFRAMLESKMKESLSGTIKISDVSYHALSEFVNYLYSAEARLDEHMACNLWELAETYQVEHLKTYCGKYLMSIKSAWCEKWLKEKL